MWWVSTILYNMDMTWWIIKFTMCFRNWRICEVHHGWCSTWWSRWWSIGGHDSWKVKPNHTSLTPLKKREKKFIYALILTSKFNYKSSIITISCFKYLLTLFMYDIGVIGGYLSYQRLIRLLCGSVPPIRSHPHIWRISLISKYTINLTPYVTN